MKIGNKRELKVEIDPAFHGQLKAIKAESEFETLAETVEFLIASTGQY